MCILEAKQSEFISIKNNKKNFKKKSNKYFLQLIKALIDDFQEVFDEVWMKIFNDVIERESTADDEFNCTLPLNV